MLLRSPATPVHRLHEPLSVTRPASARRSAWRPSPALTRLATPWLAWALLALGTCGFAAAWITLGFFNGAQNSWMAVIGALDIAWMLRLGGWPRGPRRVAIAVVATACIVALANWGVIAAQLGLMLGLAPWDSALKLGFHHAWTLAQLANGAWDLAWLALALLVAALASR